MLTILNDTLPRTSLTYFAFRVSFQETLERIALADQMGCDPHESFGFLTEVPFLRAVPAHVQLDLLAATWAKHVSNEPFRASLLDEAVLYSTCETSAHIVDCDPECVADYLRGGPMTFDEPTTPTLPDELRNLHLTLASDGDFLLLSQFEDLPPDQANSLKERYHVPADRFEPMFEALGRWYLTPEFLGNLSGLLTSREVLKSVRVLGVR